jgi:hypothetical protein
MVFAAAPAVADYAWLGRSSGDPDSGVRRTVFNGDSVSVYSELNWENLASPGSRPSDGSINNSVQSPAGINAAIVIANGFVAGGTNGAGPGSQFRTNGLAVTVTGRGSGLKIREGMIQNDGTAGEGRSTVAIANGAFVTASQLQDIDATVTGEHSKLFLTAGNVDHGCLENSTVNLVPTGGEFPEIFWVNNPMTNVLVALPSVTLNGVAVETGTDPLQIEAGDTVVFTERNGLTFSINNPLTSYRQLSGNTAVGGTGVSMRAIKAVTPRYWDIDGAKAGSGGENPLDPFGPLAPTGIWSASAANWTDAVAGDGPTAAWTAGAVASFAAANDATGTYTVTVDGTPSVSGLIVENGDLVLTGGTIAFGSGELTVGNGASLSLASRVTGKPIARVDGTSTLTLLTDQTLGGLRGTGSVVSDGSNLTVDQAQDTTFWGILNSSGPVVKAGPGELRLVRPQAGLVSEMVVAAGTLTVAKDQGNTGSLDSATVIRVNPGATFNTTAKTTTIGVSQILTGGGTVLAQDRLSYSGTNYATQIVTNLPGLTVEGAIEPGDGIGTLTIPSGTVSLAGTSVLRFELNDSATPKNDRLVVGGVLEIGTGAVIEFQVTGSPTASRYELVTATGPAPRGVFFSAIGIPTGYKMEYASNGSAVALVRIVSGFEEWATANGIPGASFTADGPDGDGIPNGVEYALGYPPGFPNSLPALTAEGTNFTLTMPKGLQAGADPRIGYFFETSTNLATWTKVAPTTQDSSMFSYQLAGGAVRSFVRVRIERTE